MVYKESLMVLVVIFYDLLFYNIFLVYKYRVINLQIRLFIVMF